MLIPKNGKLIILDDKFDQAKPIFEVLSKNNIPFTYYSGEIAKLPKTPHEDIRIVFIDINLIDGTNEAAIKSQLQQTLKRLIKKKSTYVAAIWSLKENDHTSLLDDLFNNLIPELKPITRISLAKSELFTLDVATGNYIEDPTIDVMAEINKKLEEGLDIIKSLKVLITWENIISDSTNEVISQIGNIIDKDGNWDDNIKHVFYKMAHAQLGKNLLDVDEAHAIKAALKTLNYTLMDIIEGSIYAPRQVIPEDVALKSDGVNYKKDISGKAVNLKWDNLTSYVLNIGGVQKASGGSVSDLKGSNPTDQVIVDALKKDYIKVSPQLNSALLLNINANPDLQPGNVYYKSVQGTRKRKLLQTYFKGIEKRKPVAAIPKAGAKPIVPPYEIEDISGFKFVELECTPICDYSQKKWLRSRIIPGIVYPASINIKLHDSDSFYRMIQPFWYNNQICKIVFDYKLFKTIKKDTNCSDKFLFKLKHEVLIDIQANISSHVNRPGITTVS